MAEETTPASNDILALTSQPSDTVYRRTQNQRQPVNKLPSELLSNILRIGEVEQRATRRRDQNYFTIQEVATKVCYHWRDVATKNPSLWTYIHITRPPPNPLAVLFIKRAGSGTLLEIDVELRSRYCKVFEISTKNWRPQVKLMDKLLEFLSSHGAGAHRWVSLDVSCKQPEVLINIVEHLSLGVPAPALQFLRLKRKEPSMLDSQEDRYLSDPHAFANQLSQSCLALPRLCSVELDLVPWGFVLERPLPLFGGLTRLKLTSAAARITCLTGFKNLLMANPMLEALSIDPTFTDNGNIADLPLVQLPSLQSFSIGGGSHPFSTLCILWMIQAPNLHTFSLFRSNLPMIVDLNTIVRMEHVLLHIYTGYLPEDVAETLKPTGPIYPKLRDLNISGAGMYSDTLRDHIDGILVSFPSVTRLTIYLEQTKLLFEDPEPCVLPKLVHLKITHGYGSCSKLVRMLRFREEEGHPIRTVELPRTLREQVANEDPPCTILAHFDEELDTDYDSSLSEKSVDDSEGYESTEGGEDSEDSQDSEDSENAESEDDEGSEEGSG